MCMYAVVNKNGKLFCWRRANKYRAATAATVVVGRFSRNRGRRYAAPVFCFCLKMYALDRRVVSVQLSPQSPMSGRLIGRSALARTSVMLCVFNFKLTNQAAGVAPLSRNSNSKCRKAPIKHIQSRRDCRVQRRGSSKSLIPPQFNHGAPHLHMIDGTYQLQSTCGQHARAACLVFTCGIKTIVGRMEVRDVDTLLEVTY